MFYQTRYYNYYVELLFPLPTDLKLKPVKQIVSCVKSNLGVIYLL